MEETTSNLLRLLFEAPGDQVAWWPFLDALGAAISPDVRVVTLLLRSEQGTATQLFAVNTELSVPRQLPRRSHGGPRVATLALGSVFDVPRLEERFKEHPAVRALLDPAGLEPGPGLGIVLSRDEEGANGFLFVLPVRAGWKPGAADRALLVELAPFLLAAARLHDRLLATAAVTSLLDHLVLGVILLDERGRVSYANRSAAEMFGIEAGLSEPNASGRRDPRTQALYGSVTAQNRKEAGPYHRLPNGRSAHVLATRLRWPSWQSSNARRFARAIFLGDPSLGNADPIANMGRLYGLTAGEARLAWLLVGDSTLVEAARQLGITESTARTVLKRVLAKTGTRRQASLVRLLLSGPAQVRDGEPQPPGGTPVRQRRARREAR